MTSEKESDSGSDWGWHRGWRPGKRSPWMPGLLLILIGAFFLFRNFTGFPLENWWALFILIPAIGNFSGAYESFREQARSIEASGLNCFGDCSLLCYRLHSCWRSILD